MHFDAGAILVNPYWANHNNSRLILSSAEKFKKPLWQTVWTQNRLLLLEQSVLGPHCLPLLLHKSLVLTHEPRHEISNNVVCATSKMNAAND